MRAGEESTDIRQQLLKSIRLLTIATIGLFLAIGTLALVGFLDSRHQARDIKRSGERVEEIAENNLAGLCALRADIQRRYDAGVEFLRENPDGIPGLSPETLQRSLDGQRATLDALDVIDCPTGEG